MRLPHHRYITYLVVTGLENPEIEHLLALDGLLPPEPAELERVRHDLADRPNPFGLFDDRDGATRMWLAHKGLFTIVRNEPAARAAAQVLRSPIHRRPVETMLLGGFSGDRVAKFFHDRKLPEVDEDVISTFGRLYFDVAGLGPEEWTEYLTRRSDGQFLKEVLVSSEAQVVAIADLLVQRLRSSNAKSSFVRPGA